MKVARRWTSELRGYARSRRSLLPNCAVYSANGSDASACHSIPISQELIEAPNIRGFFHVLASPAFRLLHLRPERVMGEDNARRSEEHTSELQSLMRISYAVFCLKKKTLLTN